MKNQQRGPAGTATSGFVASLTLCDGKTWVPLPNLNSDMTRTEYRNKFNQTKPFHKVSLKESMYILPRKVLVYDKE